MDYLVLVAFILYFVIVLCVGFYFYKRSHSMEDYILGGRQMNPYVTALSAQASDMSSWLLMGLPGAVMLSVRPGSVSVSPSDPISPGSSSPRG